MNEKNIKKGNILKDNDIVFSEYLENNIDGNVIDNYVSLYLLDTSNLEPKMISDDLKVSGIYKNGKIDLLNNSNYAYVKYETLEKIYNDYDMKLKPTELKIEIDNKNNIRNSLLKLPEVISNFNDVSENMKDITEVATDVTADFIVTKENMKSKEMSDKYNELLSTVDTFEKELITKRKIIHDYI